MARLPTVLGRARLQRKLQALPKAVKAPIRAAMVASANEIVAMAKNLVPVSEPNGGTLRDSIGWTWGRPPSGSIALGVAQALGGELSLTVFAGNDKAFYARWVEFGTQSGLIGGGGNPAQPFFFPAYRANKKRLKARINKAVRDAASSVAKS